MGGPVKDVSPCVGSGGGTFPLGSALAPGLAV